MNEASEQVTALMAARASKSDDEILAELAALAPLNEATAASEAVFLKHATLYLAHTEISAERLVKPTAKTDSRASRTRRSGFDQTTVTKLVAPWHEYR
jgi:hypothetical protein